MGLWGRQNPVPEPEPPPLKRSPILKRESSFTKIGYIFNASKNQTKRPSGKCCLKLIFFI